MRSANSKLQVPSSNCRRRLRRAALGVFIVTFALWLLTPHLLRLVPLPPNLFEPAAPGLEFVDRHGTPLRAVQGTNGFQGRIASLQEVSGSLVRATLAAEDKRFWQHHGFDWRATSRAALGFVRNGRVISGGSTISQQLIKLAEPRPRTLRTKLIETAQAMRLEQVWSKERILAEYFNRLDYGNRRIGVMAAAHFYFGKPPADLSEAEAAFLAGLPQSPTRLNPHAYPERAKKRQEWILQREVDEHLLTADAAMRAKNETIRLCPPRSEFRAPHFVDLLLQQREAATTRTRNLRTTLDLPLNDFSQRTLGNQLAQLRKENARDGAVVVLENRTGNILALVGSGDYFNPEGGQVNGAMAPRSAGSTFKPFTYLLALERGATPASVVADIPTEFTTPTGTFAPLNYDRRCYGPMRHRLALANSLNISAVRVLDSIGGPATLRERLTECGLTTLTRPPEFYGLGLTIGNAEARLLELANAYACIARMGEHIPLNLTLNHSEPGMGKEGIKIKSKITIKNRDGESAGRGVFAPSACYLIADILSDNSARALAFGMDSSLRFEFPVACKTGTSSNFRDNWAFAFTPEFTVGVWIGNFDGSPMREVSGVSGAAPVMHEIVVELHQRFGTSWFATPTNIVERWIHPVTGKLVAEDFPGAMREKFIAGQLPPASAPENFDASGRVRLPAEYREWLASSQSSLHGRAIAQSEESPTPRILSPQPDATYFLDPDLPENGGRLRLQANASGNVEWRSTSLSIQKREQNIFALLSEGRHELIARDLNSGTESRTWITVKRL